MCIDSCPERSVDYKAVHGIVENIHIKHLIIIFIKIQLVKTLQIGGEHHKQYIFAGKASFHKKYRKTKSSSSTIYRINPKHLMLGIIIDLHLPSTRKDQEKSNQKLTL